jgi:hypothetical protein
MDNQQGANCTFQHNKQTKGALDPWQSLALAGYQFELGKSHQPMRAELSSDGKAVQKNMQLSTKHEPNSLGFARGIIVGPN